MKFVLLFQCYVWVCEFDDNWVVYVEFACSSDIEMSTLWILLKLMNCDIALFNCGWIHDYELWLLLSVVVNVISWIGCGLSWVVVVDGVVLEEVNCCYLKLWCFEKIIFNQFHKLFHVSRNERVRCVWALGWAFDHFGWIRNLTKRFWAKNDENSWSKHMKTCISRRCAWGRALGAHYQRASARRCTPGARRPDRNNIRVVLRSGAWGSACRGPMHLFEHDLLLFSLILLLEHILLGQNLDFLNGVKLEFVTFSVFGIYRKMNFLWTKKITWLVYSSYGLRRSMWSWYEVLIMWNLVFGKNGGIYEFWISYTNLG